MTLTLFSRPQGDLDYSENRLVSNLATESVNGFDSNLVDYISGMVSGSDESLLTLTLFSSSPVALDHGTK